MDVNIDFIKKKKNYTENQNNTCKKEICQNPNWDQNFCCLKYHKFFSLSYS